MLRAIGVSAALDLVYFLVFGSRLVRALRPPPKGVPLASTEAATHPRAAAGYTLLLLVVVPAVLALLQYWLQAWALRTTFDFTWPAWVPRRGGKVQHVGWRLTYNPTPSSWDYAINDFGPRFVRVRLEDGTWVGGWMDVTSFASSYPEPRDLFIERQYRMTADGEFGDPVDDTLGVYVSCSGKEFVEWIAQPTPTPPAPAPTAVPATAPATAAPTPPPSSGSSA